MKAVIERIVYQWGVALGLIRLEPIRLKSEEQQRLARERAAQRLR